MKSKSLSLIIALLILVNVALFASPVGLKIAGTVAVNYYYEQIAPAKNITSLNQIKIKDVYTETLAGLEMYHVFNFKNGGFVIISGDDIVMPIMAYSHDGYFDHSNMGCSIDYWMGTYSAQVEYYRQKKTTATKEITDLWNRYQSNNPSILQKPKGTKDIEPFFMADWGQGQFYNAMCPEDAAGEAGCALVGCVATSMSMAMYYYRHPHQGTGSHGYYANNASAGYGNYGWQFADFANTTYQWDGMNNSLSGSNSNMSVAELCFHCGVSVEMKFGPDKSGTQTSYIPGALKTYFGYSPSVAYANRISYNQTTWENILKTNLNGKKPIVYSGSVPISGGGHAWNMDGYETNTQGVFFHCNWGWDGSGNGYYSVNDLNPGGQGPFTAYQAAVLNIYPAGTFPEHCSGGKTITHRAGSFEDGSNYMNYLDNLDCSWLIAPADSVRNIILNFSHLDTEENHDTITIYDGSSTSDPVIGTFSGTVIPTSIISTGSTMLIRFQTDGQNNASGWEVNYVTSNPEFCKSNEVITDSDGIFDDGSGSSNYSNNVTCKWRIEPVGGTNMTLHFNYFDLEEGDFINVYDWGTQQLLLSQHTGDVPPADLLATSGAAYIEFKTNWYGTGAGFEISYSVDNVGIDENNDLQQLLIYPNPVKDILNMSFDVTKKQDIDIDILSVTGELLYSEELSQFHSTYNKSIDASGFARGIYILRIKGETININKKIIIK